MRYSHPEKMKIGRGGRTFQVVRETG